MTQTSKTREYWLHLRRGFSTSGARINVFEPLEDDCRTRTGKEYAYKLKYPGLVIGGVYLIPVERTDDHVYITEVDKEFIGPFHDESVVNQLQIEDKIFREQERSKRHEKQYKTFELPKTLTGLADHYRQLKFTSDRRTFENLIIDEVRKLARAMGSK